MQYNYYYEISAVVLMLLLICAALIQSHFDLVKGRSFFDFLLSAVIESLANILSSWGLANTDLVSSTVNWWLCFFFFLAEACTSLLFFRYIVYLCESNKKRRILYARIAAIPFAVFIFMIITTKKFHLVYDVSNNVYSQGKFASFGYAYIGLFLLASFIVAITAKKTIRGRNRVAVMLATIISLAGIIIQFMFKSLLLTGVSNAIVSFMFYVVIQNPSELRDRAANSNNSRAFLLRFENISNDDKHVAIMSVDIRQNAQLGALFANRSGGVLLSDVSAFLSEIIGSRNVYHISTNVFAIIINDPSKVTSIKDNILKRFDQPWDVDDLPTILSANIYTVRYPEDVTTINEFYGIHNFLKGMIRRDALNNYIEMTPELHETFTHFDHIDQALTRALKEESFQVYFQPIYNCKRQCFTSLEALARLIDPEYGFIPPNEFIAAAEDSGTIVPLDLIILDKTCEFIEKVLLPHKDEHTIETVQVNISVLQCSQSNITDAVLDIIDRHHVPHDMITIEITESASAAGFINRYMNSLKEHGICFALDDYGTGNSNCSYLINYPFDKVKFDKSIVDSYFNSDTGKIIFDGEMKTLRNLGIPIVVEGIEEEAQLSAMEKMDVDFIQGFYFSKPLPADELLSFLKK